MPAVLHQLRRQLGPEKEGRKEGCDNVKPYTREEFEHVADRRPGPPHLEVERLVATVREAWGNEDAYFRMGLCDGIRRYAVWNDGEQRVGVMQKPLHEVLAKAKTEAAPYSPEEDPDA